jgi:hypothetical protein
VGPGTVSGGKSEKWATNEWALATSICFSNIQTQPKLENLEWKSLLISNILKLCMGLHLSILNNFITLVNFKFPIEFMLGNLE